MLLWAVLMTTTTSMIVEQVARPLHGQARSYLGTLFEATDVLEDVLQPARLISSRCFSAEPLLAGVVESLAGVPFLELRCTFIVSCHHNHYLVICIWWQIMEA